VNEVPRQNKIRINITLLKGCSINLLIRNHGIGRYHRRRISLFFGHSIFVCAVYTKYRLINQKLAIWADPFNWYFFLSSYLSKKENLGKCFINICIKKCISFSFFMPTITSYFGFLLAASTITSALFIGLSKIRLI
jgi:hypothetical protein